MLNQSETFAGRVIITWPKSSGSVMPGWGVRIDDADAGVQIVSALDLTVSMSADAAPSVVVAEMTTLTDADGQPLGAGDPAVRLDEGDGYRTARFRYLVTEMCTAR